MLRKPLLVTMWMLAAQPAFAQDRQRIEKEADLPRFTYPVKGNLEQLVRDTPAFASFAAKVRHDTESVLADYDIADKAAQRQLLTTLIQLDFLDGRYDDAEQHAAQVRALQEKPADKLLSGLQLRAMVASLRAVGSQQPDAYRQGVGQRIAAELDTLPYEVVSNDIMGYKKRAELIGEALVLGGIREVLQPTVNKTGALSSDLAPAIINARYALTAVLPLKQTLIDTYGAYLNAHKIDKADIWAARQATLAADGKYTPVNIGIWDSGVDSPLYKGRLLTSGGKPALIAFDRYARPARGELAPIPATLRARLPAMKAQSKGFSDLQSNIDSPEASALKQYLSSLKAGEYRSAMEQIQLAGNYEHGTHVAGIAVDGNPFARLAIARIEFDYHLLPDPCPSDALAERANRASQAYVDFLKRKRVRVVNMSWGGNVKGYEEALETCGIGKTPEARQALARRYFDAEKAALTKAMASASDILFVAAAGNSNQDASFAEFIPANIVLPNLLTVGAVDKAGDEAPFTSYGPTVLVHANGYQVESYVPGGERIAFSGTSMAAPQVTNLAAKLLAVKPALKPAELIAVIRDTADKTEDGRRTLINPAKALAAVSR